MVGWQPVTVTITTTSYIIVNTVVSPATVRSVLLLAINTGHWPSISPWSLVIKATCLAGGVRHSSGQGRRGYHAKVTLAMVIAIGMVVIGGLRHHIGLVSCVRVRVTGHIITTLVIPGHVRSASPSTSMSYHNIISSRPSIDNFAIIIITPHGYHHDAAE